MKRASPDKESVGDKELNTILKELAYCPPTTRETVNVVIYHAWCPDGVGAALCAYLYEKRFIKWPKNIKEPISFYPLQHGDTIPPVTGKNVLMVDICPKGEKQIIKMLEEAHELTILDHHESECANLQKFPDNCEFGTRAGVAMSWEFFFPGVDFPDWVLMVEDRDLWKFKIPGTKEFSSYMFYSGESNIQKWFELLYENNSYEVITTGGDRLIVPCQKRGKMEEYIKIGGYYEKVVDKSVDQLQCGLIKRTVFGRGVGICESPLYISALCDKILSLNPDISYAVSWSYNKKKGAWRCSIRSRVTDNDTNCIDFMRQLGIQNCGGHLESAGFKIDIDPVNFFEQKSDYKKQ